MEKLELDIKESFLQSTNLRTTDEAKYISSPWLFSVKQPDADETSSKFKQALPIEKHYQFSGSSSSSTNSGSIMVIDYDINQLITRFAPKATYGLKQSAKAWINHVQQLSDHSDYVPSFDSYTKSQPNHPERFWYDKTKLMYYGDPPLLLDTTKDDQWYFDVTNPIVISIKSILTFMMIHIGSSGSKFNPHNKCDEEYYKCSGSSKCSGSNGSSGSTGSSRSTGGNGSNGNCGSIGSNDFVLMSEALV